MLCVFLHAELLWILGLNNQDWFCTSVDLIENILNASPYCNLSGNVVLVMNCHYSYFIGPTDGSWS